LLDSGPRSGSWNMASDELLLELAERTGVPVLHFYRWDPAALSLGYAQPLERHVNIACCREKGVPVVRRMTGGKAVFHDRELTYSLSGPAAAFPFSGDLMESYKTIAQAFLAGLDHLGIRAEMAPRQFRAAGAGVSSCFAQPSAFEILVNGRKLIGSAQKRTRRSVLQHGSLLIDFCAADWEDLLVNPGDDVSSRVTSLKEELHEAPPVEAVMESVLAGFRKTFGIEFELMVPSLDDLRRIEELSRLKYPNLILNLDSLSSHVLI
jgi:lipoyl(octanoyl) transferase